MIALGASAYKEPLLIGITPSVFQTFRTVDRYKDERFLYAEYSDEKWCLHCAPFVGEQSGCITCFLTALREFRRCPWRGEETCDRTFGGSVAHLVGTDTGDGKANVVGYIDPFPLHIHFIVYHVLKLPYHVFMLVRRHPHVQTTQSTSPLVGVLRLVEPEATKGVALQFFL